MNRLIILAGGKGTRLKERLGDLPKPLIPIAGRPLLEHHIELARKHGFNEVVIFACYRADLIEQALGDGSRWGMRITYQLEKEPLGTAGAVLDGLNLLADRFLVLYGDTMVNVDLQRLWKTHEQTGANATLLLHPNDHPLDSDLVETDDAGWVTGFHGRPHPEGRFFQNLVNAGLYVLEKKALAPFIGRRGPGGILDFGKDLFPEMLRGGSRLLGYNSPEYIKDIGTPHRYDRVSAEFAAGVVGRSALDVPQRAVFLDRDGTVVPDRDCARSADQIELMPGAAEAIRTLNHHGWRTVLVTNQPVVAKGWATEADIRQMHNKLETLLGREHAFLDRIYYCPHHPEAGHPGERKDLKIPCECRKPGIGMIRRAMAELNIDPEQSWMIGDTTTDLQTARNAGLRAVLVNTGCCGKDNKYPAQPDHCFDSLTTAAEHIVKSTAHTPAP